MDEPASIINVALFGFGRAGRIHFKNLKSNPRVEIKYILEEFTKDAEEAVIKYRLNNTRVVHSSQLKEILNDSSIHACVIATPTQTHETYVLASLRADKAVFCEKPLANSVETIARCYDEAKKRNLPLVCDFNRRFDPGLREIHDRTKSGEVGQVQIIKMTSRDSALPSVNYLKISSGIFHDCAIHDIDVVAWIYRERPVSVYTTAHSFVKEIGDVNDYDSVAIVLKFPSGGIGLIDISRFASFGYDQRIEVFGNEGMLVQHNYRPTNVEFSSKIGTSVSRVHNSFPERYAESYIKALDHFFGVCEGKCDAEITKEGTLLASEIAEACDQSVKTGQAVTLPQKE